MRAKVSGGVGGMVSSSASSSAVTRRCCSGRSRPKCHQPSVNSSAGRAVARMACCQPSSAMSATRSGGVSAPPSSIPEEMTPLASPNWRDGNQRSTTVANTGNTGP